MRFDENLVLQGIKVLIVDDDLDGREFLAIALEMYGAEISKFATANAALAVLDEWQPQLIISDIAMPEESGYTLIQKIRSLGEEQGGTIPAIALTGMASEEDRRQALQFGFDEHLPKPVDLERLLAVILVLLQKHKLE